MRRAICVMAAVGLLVGCGSPPANLADEVDVARANAANALDRANTAHSLAEETDSRVDELQAEVEELKARLDDVEAR